ncbi:MAG: sugar transferase [Candidatus Omnitrophica bacterium]|nr:sugar transferase [Candidatus Omnitrophota bacterium]
MTQRNFVHTSLIRLVYTLLDVIAVTLAFYLACFFRPQTIPFPVGFEGFFLSPHNPYRLIFVLWLLVVLFFNQAHNLYQTRRTMLETMEIWEVVKSVLSATFVGIIITYLLKVQDFPRSVLIISVILQTIFLSSWRIAKKILVDYLVSNGYNNFNALIIGAGKIGRLLEKEIKNRPGLGIKVIGFLDDFKDVKANSKDILGRVEDFSDIVRRSFVKTIFVTIHPDDKMLVSILEQSKELDVAVRVVPQGFEWMSKDTNRFNIGVVPILEYTHIEVSYRQQAKRVFDFVLSVIGFICFMPVFLFLGIWIKMDSRGPIFYTSQRYGKGGRIFHMLKFRSMVINADELLAQLKVKNEVDGPIFKIRKDPRITKVGAFLRKYSLDELPQILNVIFGDMSLVGPRPLPIEQIEKEDLRQLKRLNIRPGITGLWQIRGRSDVSFQRFLRWDIWYINNWSFSLDLYILFQTLPVVIKGRGAY